MKLSRAGATSSPTLPKISVCDAVPFADPGSSCSLLAFPCSPFSFLGSSCSGWGSRCMMLFFLPMQGAAVHCLHPYADQFHSQGAAVLVGALAVCCAPGAAMDGGGHPLQFPVHDSSDSGVWFCCSIQPRHLNQIVATSIEMSSSTFARQACTSVFLLLSRLPQYGGSQHRQIRFLGGPRLGFIFAHFAATCV